LPQASARVRASRSVNRTIILLSGRPGQLLAPYHDTSPRRAPAPRNAVGGKLRRYTVVLLAILARFA
jgi:hypothetical protein